MMKSAKSILVATDLSEASDEVMRAAGALAAVVGATLHVLHSFDFPAANASAEQRALLTFPDQVAGARERLAAQIARTIRPGVAIGDTEVLVYVAHRAIIEQAAAVGADVIVMGPHRGKAGTTPLLGSTADRVLRTAKAPCLIVRGPLSLPLRRVLVPLDLSEPAMHALEAAVEWQQSFRAAGDTEPELIVLHVLPAVLDADNVLELATDDLHREVQQVLEASSATSVALREEVKWADSPAAAINEMSAEEGVDLVVLGTHGYGAVKRALIGSVASTVARGAACPVLLIPPELQD